MAFPWVAVAGGTMGVGSAIGNWLGQRSSADAYNDAAYSNYIAERSAAFASTRANDQVNNINYAWKLAETEAIRFSQAQEKSDYDFVMGRMADSALASLGINEEAIFDQYFTAENLRAEQEQLGLDFELGRLSDKSGNETSKISNELAYQMADLANTSNFQVDKLRLETNDAVRSYITKIKDNAMQARASSMAQNRKLEALIQSQVIDGQMDALQRDISFATSLADRGQLKASGLGRGVSAKTARSLQMNKAKELGRSYGELLLKQRKRKNSLASMNAAMQGEVAESLGRFALDSSKAMQDIGSAEERFEMGKQFEVNRFNQTGSYQLGEASRAGNYAINTARREGTYRTDVFEKLTIPGFKLAGRQGERELESLFIETQGVLDRANMPYRESIIFDPQKPLPGLYTNVTPPTYKSKPGVGSLIADAVVGGVKGAMGGRGTDTTGKGFWY